jgi:hypothetical protein
MEGSALRYPSEFHDEESSVVDAKVNRSIR